MSEGNPLIDRPDDSIEAMAVLFEDMAKRLRLNAASTFGGALVIVPPKDGGEPLEMLILDSRQDVAQFWSLVKSKSEIELGRLADLARSQRAFSGGR